MVGLRLEFNSASNDTNFKGDDEDEGGVRVRARMR
jgi:hypothetical protein